VRAAKVTLPKAKRTVGALLDELKRATKVVIELEGGKGAGRSRVDDRRPGRVPSPSEFARGVSVEGRLGVSLLNNTPRGDQLTPQFTCSGHPRDPLPGPTRLTSLSGILQSWPRSLYRGHAGGTAHRRTASIRGTRDLKRPSLPPSPRRRRWKWGLVYYDTLIPTTATARHPS